MCKTATMTNLKGNVAKAASVCEKLHKTLVDEAVVESLIKLLKPYQPGQVTLYEVERCRYTLKHVSLLSCYLKSYLGKEVSVFLPSNLPLYSTLLFAVMPAIVSKTVTIRPNTALIKQGVTEELFAILDLPRLLPNIEIFCGSREKFREIYLSEADLIIFTGRNETRDEIKKCMKPNSYLINNGSGHNPIVVGEDADLELSTNEIMYARFFNSGQDCAGPDAVFVHDNLMDKFLMRIKEKVSHLYELLPNEWNELKREETSDISAEHSKPVLHMELAKIHRIEELQRLQSVIDSFRENIIIGGCVDLANRVVHPTIIYDHISASTAKGTINFSELFGPIMFLYGYSKEEDLKIYFENSRYTQNKMYVSLFGTCAYLQSKNDEILLQSKGSAKGGVGIVLHNKIIHDINVDNGTVAYGGYSKGGSSILHKAANRSGKISSIALPILLPKVMYELFVKQIPLRDLLSRSPTDSCDDKDIKISQSRRNSATTLSRPDNKNKLLKQRIATEILSMIKSTFGANLNFGFAFGSVTDEKYSLEENGICTFVCTNKPSIQQYTLYTRLIEELHRSYRYDFDHYCPVELTTCSELNRMTYQLYYQLYGENYNPWMEDEEPLNCSFLDGFHCHDEYTYRLAFMVSVLAEKPKFALVTRNKPFFHSIVDAAKEVVNLIRTEMLETLGKRVAEGKSVPEVLRVRYPGNSGNEIMKKLEDLSCCELLRHVEWMPPM